VDVYVETGSKRAFASALDWPGLSRAGRDEAAALAAVAAYGPRYARVVARSRVGFRAPASAEDLRVIARVRGTATTDFGAPGVPAPGDAEAIDAAELKRLATILRACWRALDAAAEGARGRRLATGPRGGGRSLDGIIEHVAGAERGYLGAIGRKAPGDADAEGVRRAVVDGLTSAAVHGVEERGPRGGKRWPPRYFVRRTAWHALDHAWEIEDRST
jgi:hypothetical protein